MEVKGNRSLKLSKPIALKITNLLYNDDLKIYAAPESKLYTVLKTTRDVMKDIGHEWNSKKSSVANIKRGKSAQGSDAKVDEEKVIKHLEEGTTYKFLGVLESVKQEDKLLQLQGVTLDNKLKFDSHIAYICRKAGG